jgi:uroporphyrinogen-III decarboxylase
VLWFLGDCLPLVEDIARAGYDLLHIEQDRRGYSSDPAEFRKRIGTDLCITGWTYELDMINDNREAISHTIRHQIETAGQEGAFIYGSTFIGADVAPETVDFMYEEVRRIWGETQGSSDSASRRGGSINED